MCRWPVVDLPDGLRAGSWVSAVHPLLRVVSPGRYDVAAFAPETDRRAHRLTRETSLH